MRERSSQDTSKSVRDTPSGSILSTIPPPRLWRVHCEALPHAVPRARAARRLFRTSPRLAIDLLRAVGVDVTGPAHLVESTFPVTAPDYHADAAVTCGDPASPSLVVLVEIQLQADADKERSWPLYQAAARAKWKCEACVLVVAVDERVAAWARTPIALGPGGSQFCAVVLGPDAVPRVALGDDSVPELALLSALAHGATEPETIGVALAATSALDDERARAYFDLLRYHLREALGDALEAIMATSEHKYLSDFARKYYGDGWTAGEASGEAKGKAEGEAKGRRDALLAFIDARALVASPDARARIEACSDVAVLDHWIARAATAATVDELLAE